MERKEYTLKQYVLAALPLAEVIYRKFDIPIEITITQSAHESDFGNSQLTQDANNLFGFTGESWEQKGKPIIKMKTREYINGQWKVILRPFRAYKDWLGSMIDWATTISTFKRYKAAYSLAQTGKSTEYYHAVQQAGYATDPRYASKLVQLEPHIKEVLKLK